MSRARLVVFACVWTVAVVGGLRALWRYSGTAGDAGTYVERWPAGSALRRRPGRPTLVMVLHARCPCSRASLSELAEILGLAGDGLDAWILVVGEGSIVDAARALRGATVWTDQAAREARRFGAETSGHTLLYDGAGQLVFAGGVTAARGHGGPNEGRASVLAWLKAYPASARTPVFGCPMSKENRP